MYRIIFALMVVLGVVGLPSIAHAKPVHIHHVKKHNRIKKKSIIVQANHNPFLHCENKDCSNKPKDVASYAPTEELTASQFFREDNIRRQNLIDPPLLTREQKRQSVAKSCSWFSCQNNDVVMQAKAWEGKSTKHNRKELKELFADAFNYPVDPANIPWCAAFANAILRRENMPTTHSLMARSFLNWGLSTRNPKEGDVVVLARGKGKVLGHVGFFVGYEMIEGVKYVKVLGGNTDHAVRVGYYLESKVVSYRTFA